MSFRTNNFYFNKVVLNRLYNKRSTFLRNFYEAMVYLAFKFREICNLVEHRIKRKNIEKLAHRVIKVYSSKAKALSLTYSSKCD